MICPTCKGEINIKLKKYERYICQCGANLMLIELYKEFQLVDLNNKGEK